MERMTRKQHVQPTPGLKGELLPNSFPNSEFQGGRKQVGDGDADRCLSYSMDIFFFPEKQPKTVL